MLLENKNKDQEDNNRETSSVATLEKPKVNPHITQMQEVLSDCMQIEVNQLSIKATTSEKMGFVGTEKGIAAHAVALLKMG